ncbi:MAG TPA: PBP1A family penicillin-binding protein [Candidatus Binataceae bacterium]|nr:PBP1A family penicillin-binding protein [Candidatus Binataceae bacterium]
MRIALFTAAAVILFVVPPLVYYCYSYYTSLENEVVTRFSGKRWDIPSQIYSDSLVVYPGTSLDDVGFYQRLARLNYRPRPSPAQVGNRGEYCIDLRKGRLVIFLHAFAYPYHQFDGQLVDIRLNPYGMVTDVLDGVTHKPIDTFELEPEPISGIYEGAWEQRRLVRLTQIPPAFIDAILAAEDHRFYEHHGLDPIRIVKAAWINLHSGHVVQGGSTLTQQLMKNFFLTQKRDWHRKIKEALMAYIAESRYSKEEILENYLNDIYLGQRGQEGIYGVWEASEYYFSKVPRDLTIGEMATIAGMIRSPNRYNPLRHPEAARKRRDEVLELMLVDGYIGRAALAVAMAEPMETRETFTENNDAPYFVDYVKHELAERYPPEVLTGEGLRVFTTLDVHTEKVAERAVQVSLAKLEAKHPRLRRKELSDRLEAALVAIEPQSGKLRAMVGGRDYRASQFNRVVQSHRQPGSIFKPVTYLAALEETISGEGRFRPTSMIDDERFTWYYGGGLSWTPSNYKNRYFGEVTLQFALEESLNSATSRLAHEVGLHRIREMARKLGFGDLPPYPSIVLGGMEVTPMQVARAYAILANGGLEVPPYAVTAVEDREGRVIEGHEIKAEQVLPANLAYEMDYMLQQVIKHGTGHDAIKAGFKRAAAGKTGTTNDEKDAWFAGFTPDLLAVVWTGFDKKEELDLTGAQAALPIWTAFMVEAEAGRPETTFPTPPGIGIWNARPPPTDEEAETDTDNESDEPADAESKAPADAASTAPAESKPEVPESDPND